jgi:hypothetical protein
MAGDFLIADVVEHNEFRRLRLRDFADDVIDLQDWEFMDRTWVGEAIGFTEWLRPEEDPDNLGSMALDLVELSPPVSQTILERIQLPLSRGMTFAEVSSVLGEAVDSQSFVSDRTSFDFLLGNHDRYSVSCTILHQGGLIYVVVSAVQ